jgi:hypothetical protein
MSAQEMTLFQSGDWLVASDEPAGTVVPRGTERWIATDQPMEVRQ